MASILKRSALGSVSYLLPERGKAFLARFWLKSLREELTGAVTNTLIELLLNGMDLVFRLSGGYRKNIENFRGRYLFKTADDTVVASAIFDNGNMEVHQEAINDWDARVTFKDGAALRSFIFSKNQDILDSVLKNEVEVDGNLNYIYKFGFMARDLLRRIGIG